MKYIHAANILGGQDGAIFGDTLFRFDARGNGRAYCLDGVTADCREPLELSPFAEFRLGGLDRIVPHSNAVVFGSEYWAEGDEFPLLYSNIYNNYSKAEDRLEGVVCVYRLQRDGASFSAELVQLIRIGFVEDRSLWKSLEGNADVRSYGNFVVDRERQRLYAFVMRDAKKVTRCFTFRLPAVREGVTDPQYGVPAVTLTPADILRQFDSPYMRYMQGACCRDGKIYSSEGFSGGSENPPALRFLDTDAGAEVFYDNLADHDMPLEAEFIDFHGDDCLYGDARGHLFILRP